MCKNKQKPLRIITPSTGVNFSSWHREERIKKGHETYRIHNSCGSLLSGTCQVNFAKRIGAGWLQARGIVIL